MLLFIPEKCTYARNSKIVVHTGEAVCKFTNKWLTVIVLNYDPILKCGRTISNISLILLYLNIIIVSSIQKNGGLLSVRSSLASQNIRENPAH